MTCSWLPVGCWIATFLGFCLAQAKPAQRLAGFRSACIQTDRLVLMAHTTSVETQFWHQAPPWHIGKCLTQCQHHVNTMSLCRFHSVTHYDASWCLGHAQPFIGHRIPTEQPCPSISTGSSALSATWANTRRTGPSLTLHLVMTSVWSSKLKDFRTRQANPAIWPHKNHENEIFCSGHSMSHSDLLTPFFYLVFWCDSSPSGD